MKKKIFAALLLTVLLCTAFCTTVFAETEAVDTMPTEDVFATEATEYSELPTETETQPVEDYSTEPSVPDTSYIEDESSTASTEASSSDTTASTETTTTESTTVQTNPPAPTEPEETNTYSDYESPAPVYTPADQDFEENDWQEIKLDLSADPVSGKGSFAYIQENNRKGNDSIAGFLIAGIVLIFLSIAGFTFVILYKGNRKKTPATSKVSTVNTRTAPRHSESPRTTGTHRAQHSQKPNRTRSTNENRRSFNPDDYNDGF